MNIVKLIGAISAPPVLEEIDFGGRKSPKLRFLVAAAYEGFDGQPRQWRHSVEIIGNTAPTLASTITAGSLVLVTGSLNVRPFKNRTTGLDDIAYDIKGQNVMPVSATLTNVTRRDDGSYVADETIINEIEIAGNLTAAPYSGPDGDTAHPTVLSVGVPDIRSTKNHVDVIKAKTWDADVAAQYDNLFERSLVLVQGMLLSEYHRDEATGRESGGPYIRILKGGKL